MMATEQITLQYYDLKVQKEELERKMEELKSKSRTRAQQQEKLSLFYQNELEQWLSRIEKDKIIWKQKRNHLSNCATHLQECIQTKRSSANTKLNQEKDKYCNIIIKLMPEWHKVIETKQMKEISQYESKLSLIQQRRQSAHIAFEKEKKLLSLISIRQKQIQTLENEEKQDAVIREHQRQSIIDQEKDYDDTMKCTKLQQHIIRQEVTSELKKRLSDQYQLLQHKTEDIHDHQTLDEKAEEKKQQHIEEEKEDIHNSKDEEGNETAQINVEQNDNHNMMPLQNHIEDTKDTHTEEHNSDVNTSDTSNSDDDDDIYDDTSKIEKAVGLIEIRHHQLLQNNETKENTEINNNILQKEPLQKQQNITEKTETETEPIIQNAEPLQKHQNIAMKQESTSGSTMEPNTKIKRSFRSRSRMLKNRRLSFAVLESPNKNSSHRSQQLNVKSVIMKEHNKNQTKSTLSNRKINSLNDFEDDNVNVIVTDRDATVPLKNNESSDDEFDF